MRKQQIIILFLSILLFCSAKAQYAGNGSICNHLISSGRVNIMQDDRLTALLGSQPKTYYANEAQQDRATKQKVKGYRIRVFSGNQQNKSKNRAYKIQSEFNESLPDINTYVSFKTPNWRVVVGDFRTSEEANSMLRILRKEFPAYSNDMFVVSDVIEL